LKWSDKHFINKVAESTQREIALAQLAAQRATNADVRSFAQQLVTEHEQMSHQLDQLADQKGLRDEIAEYSPNTQRAGAMTGRAGAGSGSGSGTGSSSLSGSVGSSGSGSSGSGTSSGSSIGSGSGTSGSSSMNHGSSGNSGYASTGGSTGGSSSTGSSGSTGSFGSGSSGSSGSSGISGSSGSTGSSGSSGLSGSSGSSGSRSSGSSTGDTSSIASSSRPGDNSTRGSMSSADTPTGGQVSPGSYAATGEYGAVPTSTTDSNANWNDPTRDRHYRKLAKKDGAEFDKEFVSMMVEEHEDDVNLFDKKTKNADDMDVRSFAQETLPKLQHHLQEAQRLAAQQKS